MTRLIDADTLKEKIIELLEIEWGYEGIREDVSRIIDSMPTTEERPHGEWLKCETMTGRKVCVCSICKSIFGSDVDKSKPCPNCGADMRKERG